jgi:hypothetical protein
MVVGIIGGRGTGKTVFVSLLSTTAIDYSIKSNRHFRYWTDPIYTKAIGDIVSTLKLRTWPPATLKGSLSQYEFYFGYTNALTRALMSVVDAIDWITRHKIYPGKGELFNKLKFTLYDISGEDVDIISQVVDESRKRGLTRIDEMMPQNLRTLLDCKVLVFLIDSSKITTDASDPRYKSLLEYDTLMAQLMSVVAAYRSQMYGDRAGKLYPVFVLTKFDTVEKKVLNTLGIPDNLDAWVKESSREDIRERFYRFMKGFFGHTLSLIYGGTLMGVELDRGQVFLSYMGTEVNEEGILVPRLISKAGIFYELDYSISEYIEFIKYFGKIAGDLKAPQEKMEEYITGLGR